ncbi:Major Facilitator Superfamily protein [Streptomyces sp. SolWspMP-sol7th]|nr:Major Facilitator Superfamily protein [Streptomyces sp. SolWspMP-sol7th]
MPHPPPASPSRFRLVTALCLVTIILAVLDSNIVSAAAVPLVRDLDPEGGLAKVPWLVTAFQLAATAALPLYGKLCDTLGAKRVFLGALGIFLLGSALCGFARSMPQLLAFRALQGVGGGGLMSITLVVIRLASQARKEAEPAGAAEAARPPEAAGPPGAAATTGAAVPPEAAGTTGAAPQETAKTPEPPATPEIPGHPGTPRRPREPPRPPPPAAAPEPVGSSPGRGWRSGPGSAGCSPSTCPGAGSSGSTSRSASPSCSPPPPSCASRTAPRAAGSTTRAPRSPPPSPRRSCSRSNGAGAAGPGSPRRPSRSRRRPSPFSCSSCGGRRPRPNRCSR